MGTKKAGRSTSLFRRMTNATFRKRPKLSRGAANGPMQIASTAHRGLNILVILGVLAGVAAILFILIPRVLDSKSDADAQPRKELR